MTRPGRILEVGTATGFSALLMDHWAPAGCRITTMEKMPARISQARANFLRYGAADRITLLEGDAMELLPQLEGPFDFIFMDAAKGQYIHYLPEIKRLLPPGGLLISDNILQQEELLESRFAVTRRNRTIYKRMREYLRAITGDPDLTTLILELGDGAAVTYRKA
jgi:predicted O-methyltransferase YrrM